ncbi:AlbA family DNA-binding domain-containing protein [Burkholderia gladioli]|uniref:AlbA family DNA-binding domain-containing protein n=1 Tax=Burkholderia gladioli TaxID=28095 RepID=UPI001364A44F|nr:ATP-binding protein [Burkholderia gladioli]KAF1063378.1 hypothetical protein LvStA_02018 [Burkholderia gladioli]MDN7600372.1 ATP-binding protein [Burkholderia gladioli]MDN7812375.1 ATP-binding protein [Burkholderia gladioli]
MPIPSKLSDTTQAHLEQVIAEQTQEGSHVDLKRQLPAAWDNSSRHELFADASAFANAGGGDLIYGIDEDGEGRASVLVPLQENPDETSLRLADLLLNGVEPRMPGVQVQPVPVEIEGVSGTVFVIRIPQSWAGPHRVKTNFKFYIREGNRKREIDVPELRGLFLRSESQAQKVRDFRTERLGKILSGEIPCRLAEGSIWVLHLIPTQAALGVGYLDPLPYVNFVRHIPRIGSQHPGSSRINIDGAFSVRNEGADGRARGYTQLFRNGFVEGVFAIPRRDDRCILPGRYYEESAAMFLEQIRAELISAGFDTELTAMMSLLGADNIQLEFDRFNSSFDANQGFFDRPTVVLPDVLIRGDGPPLQALKPMFDLVWQAAGIQGSINFKDSGEWRW